MFLRINDTIILLEDIREVNLNSTPKNHNPATGLHFAARETGVILSTKDGRNYFFTGEAADAVRRYFDDPDWVTVVHLDKLFKQPEPPPEPGHGSGPLPGRDVTVVQTGEKTKFITPPLLFKQPVVPPSRCFIKQHHLELTVPCPACGQKPGQELPAGPEVSQ